MEKNVRPYKQKGDTCSIVCMLMILEYYKVIEKINWYEERRLYKIYKSKYMNGTPFSALAFHLAKNGLDTTIYHEKESLFENNSTISKNDFELSMEEYKEYLNLAKNKGVKVINGIYLDTQVLKQKLKEDNLIILAGQMLNCYHAILLIGYNTSGFIVCDPLYKTKLIKSFNEIDNFMNTNIGKWFIAVKSKV